MQLDARRDGPLGMAKVEAELPRWSQLAAAGRPLLSEGLCLLWPHRHRFSCFAMTLLDVLSLLRTLGLAKEPHHCGDLGSIYVFDLLNLGYLFCLG